MKTSGIKIENFPILGEVTCKARDPFSFSLPGDFFSFLPRFSSLLLPGSISASLLPAARTRPTPTTTKPSPPPASAVFLFSFLWFARSSSSSSSSSSSGKQRLRWSAGQLELAGTLTLRWFQAVQSGGKGLNSMVEPSISLILAWIIESQFLVFLS